MLAALSDSNIRLHPQGAKCIADALKTNTVE